MNKSSKIDLEKRLAYLEQANRFKMMALDLTKELEEFHSSINKLEDPSVIFEKCRDRAVKIIGFKQMAFLLVNEGDSDFHIYRCYPETDKEQIEKELSIFIEDGTFSRAVLEKKTVIAYSKDFNHQLLLHALATSSRVRGMFVGVLEKNTKHIEEAAIEILSILMVHCANAIESFELYYRLKESNITLEEKLKLLSISEACLKDEIKDHKKTEAALESSEKQYRQLAETAKEIIITISEEGQIIYSNESAIKISGYSKQVMMKKGINEVIENFDDIMEDHYKSNADTHPAVLLSKIGDKISLEINIKSISNDDAPVEILIVGRDISERLEAEKGKKYLEGKLWQAHKMESIGLLAGGIAHDFNNILGIISSYTELSLLELPKDSEVYNYLTQIQKASNRASDLARKLHTIGKKDDHKKNIIDIKATINETIDLLKSSMGDDIEIKTKLVDKGLNVLGEETRIQQILMNLITNAVYAIAKEDGIILVSACKIDFHDGKLPLSLDLKPGSYIKLSVKDDGPGIDPAIIQRVFDPYFSTKRGKSNSGLGLSVVHGIVKNYNGAVEVDTQIGKGTSFHIYLPEAEL
ncbi:MAG: PAS domain S-box protein [Desulfobacteraceae bacterium]|nr:PAS domain S-box protein [Desulfobacteraceae bacterium]